MDDVADIQQADASPAIDGRGDAGEAELHLRLIDRRGITLNRRRELGDERLLGVVGLLRGVLALNEVLIALQILLRVG